MTNSDINYYLVESSTTRKLLLKNEKVLIFNFSFCNLQKFRHNHRQIKKLL